MTQEDKDLLLKDICGRIPYGVKYMKYSWDYGIDQEFPEVEVLEYIDKNSYISHTKVYKINDIKPYLFPLSSMTEEQKKEYHYLCIEEEREQLEFGEWVTVVYYHNTIESIDWLNAHHFDYRGLIEKGLAIDATNKNIY